MQRFLFLSLLIACLWWGCTSTREDAGEKTKITIATHWGAGFKEELLEYIDEYERLNPHISIQYRSVPYPDILRSVIISHLSGESPDIYHVYSLWGAQLIDNGILALPPDSIRQFVAREYTSSEVEGTTVHDLIYGVPTEVSTFALFYRKDFFREQGITNPPQTWNELFEMAKLLTRYTADGNIARAGFAFPREWDTGIVLPFYAMLWSHGGELFKNTKDDLTNERETIEKVIRHITDFYSNNICDASFSYATFPRDLFSGRIAMALLTPDWESQLRAGLGEDFEYVGIEPVPRGNVGRVTAGYNWFYAVDSNSKVQEEAWKFIHWLNSARNKNNKASRMGTFLVNLGMLPARKSDLEAHPGIQDNPFVRPFLESLPFTRAEPPLANGGEIKTMLMREIEYASLGVRSPDETTGRIIERVQRLYYENR